jgi:hypothetical protein
MISKTYSGGKPPKLESAPPRKSTNIFQHKTLSTFRSKGPGVSFPRPIKSFSEPGKARIFLQ